MLEFECLHFFIKLIYYLLLTVVIRDTLDYLSLILFKIIGRYLISLIQKYETLTRNITLTVFFVVLFCFFLSGFFFHSTFTIHRTAGDGKVICDSNLPLPPTSRTLRHSPGDYCRQVTSAYR